MASLQKSLGLTHGVALYVGSVLGTGVLVLPAIAAKTAGPASLLAWLALILLSLPMALTYAALSVQRADAGGFSDAIERAFGPRWGAVAGWLFVAQYPTGSVVAALIAGDSLASVAGRGDLALVFGGGLLAVAYGLNAIGLRISALAQLVTLAVIAAGLSVIVGSVLPYLQPAAFTPFFPRGYGSVGLAAVQLFWAFVGWEVITPLAREFRNPRDIWRATVIAVVIVGVVYLALAVAVIGHPPPAGSEEAPLVYLARRAFGSSASRVVGIAGFLLCFIPLNVYAAGTSRLIYSQGQRRQMPAALGILSTSGTPRRALAMLAVGSAAALGVVAVLKLQLADLLPISTSSFIATYVLSMAAAVKLLRSRMRAAALLALVSCLVVLAFVGPLVLWLGGVALASLAFQAWAARRSDQDIVPTGP